MRLSPSRDLSDKELCIRVVELLGATEIRYVDGIPTEAYWPEEDEGRGEGWRPVKDYLNNMEAVWELWRAIQKNGWKICLTSGRGTNLVLSKPPDTWWEEGDDAGREGRIIARAFVEVMDPTLVS